MDEVGQFSRIIHRVMNQGQTNDSLTLIHHTNQTTVYKVEDLQTYAVRISVAASPAQSTQLAILQEIGSVDGIIATILHTEKRLIDGRPCTIDIMPFLPGAALRRYPSSAETQAIVKTMESLHQALYRATPRFQDSPIPRLADVFQGLLATSRPGLMRSRAESLLADKRFMHLLDDEDQCLVYGDPWPANLLLTHDGSSVSASIVDVDPILIGPRMLQPALLFSAYFVASSVLFENSESRPDLDSLIQLWPEQVSREDIVELMRVYPILLSLVKSAESERTVHSEANALDANLQLLRDCLALIDTYG